jgi:hypothetical protein
MRVSEVLKIRPIDVHDRKIILPDPKNGLAWQIYSNRAAKFFRLTEAI